MAKLQPTAFTYTVIRPHHHSAVSAHNDVITQIMNEWEIFLCFTV